MNLREIFAHRLTEAIKASSFSQRGLAAHREISPNTVQNWTKGKRWPDPEVIDSLANDLNVTTQWLLGGPDPQDQPFVRTIADIRQEVMKAVDPRLEELVEVAGRLSDDNLEAIIKTARVFAGETADEVLGKEKREKA